MGFSVSFQSISPTADRCVASAVQNFGGDYEILVMEACGALSDAKGGVFHIGGFGDDEWPLDVAYDMSAFMEQLPSLLVGLREQCEVEVDLYSQGVERSLIFRPIGNSVMVHCRSRTDWTPIPSHELIAENGLVSMLLKLVDDFTAGLRAINFNPSEMTSLERWLKAEA